MRNRFRHLAPVFSYVGTLLMVFAGLILMPLFVLIFTAGKQPVEVSAYVYIIPAALSFVLGAAFQIVFRRGPLGASQSMLVCALGWIAISAIGAMPFWMTTLPSAAANARADIVNGDPAAISYLDACFEAVAGFTTTGITMFAGLDDFPPSILFWRSLTQWLGGIGILSFFILVLFSAGSAHTLYGAESHKVFSQRPKPGIFNTVKILWLIYGCFTVALTVTLKLCGVGIFDSINLAFTTLSSGGFAPYDESIAYFSARATAFPHYRAIEYVVTLGMMLAGINFFVHYRVLTGRVKALWDTGEIRFWWLIIAGGTSLVLFDVVRHVGASSFAEFEERFRASIFQVVSVLTTTGFGTKDIADMSVGRYFWGVSKQVFLILMIFGGCVGSTGGGIKVYRIQLLIKTLISELRSAVRPQRAVRALRIDDAVVEHEEIQRAGALFFAWVALIAIGGIATAALTRHGALESFSGMVSAVSNIGPCYISATGLMQLPASVKLIHIFGMLAGRLEILPVLMLFNRRAWT